jgi:hypothetical protein
MAEGSAGRRIELKVIHVPLELQRKKIRTEEVYPSGGTSVKRRPTADSVDRRPTADSVRSPIWRCKQGPSRTNALERGDHSGGADRQRAGRDTLGSRAHSESRASSLDRRRFPRVGPIDPKDLAIFGFQDNHAAGDSGTRLARLSDTGPVGVPIAVAVFHPSSLPVIMAYRESRQSLAD